MNIVDEIKRSYKDGSYLTKLIYINLSVFLVIWILDLFLPDFFSWFAVPADPQSLITKPWTPLTYMFLHKDFLHILFNMLWLFWFGKIFLQFLNQKKLLSTYLLGGFAGAFLYIVIFNLFSALPQYSVALGASASVMAIVIATTVYASEFELHLMFLGRVKLKYIALIVIGLDVMGILAADNIGGHIAHLGGAAYGFLYIRQLQSGNNISAGFERFLDKVFTWFKPTPHMRVTHRKTHKTKKGFGFGSAARSTTTTGKPPRDDKEYNRDKNSRQERIDEILDKISKNGYDSLSKEEKEFLFKQSKK